MIYRLLLVLVLFLQPLSSLAIKNREDYRLRIYDKLTIIQNGETLVSNTMVLPNGHIIVPKYGELEVVDKDLNQLSKVFSNSEFLVSHQSKNVSVIGEVKSPGAYSPVAITTVYDAIASAGGFGSLADKRSVMIIRQYKDGTRESFEVNFPKEVFKAYEKGIGEDKYTINEGDIIYVPKSRIKQLASFGSNLFKTAFQVATIGLLSGAISSALD